MKRFFGILGKAVYWTWTRCWQKAHASGFFGILGNAVYWTAIALAGMYLPRWVNGERFDFDVVHRVMIVSFFLGFMIGSYKGKSSPAPLEAGRHFLKGWRAFQLGLRGRD